MPRSPYERLMTRVERVGDCLLYTGSTDKAGYGTVSVGHNGCLSCHRVVYEHLHGPIRDGYVVRHTCDTPNCVEPTHLILGTQADNINDMIERGRERPWNRDVTHCKSHHEFTPSNTYIHPTTGNRQCRTCRADAVRRYQERRRAS